MNSVAELSFLAYALSSLVLAPTSTMSMMSFIILCLFDHHFLIIVPSYYLLCFPKSRIRLSSLDIGILVILVAIVLGMSKCLSDINIINDSSVLLSAIANGPHKRSRIMKFAHSLDQLPMKILTEIESLVQLLYSNVFNIRGWLLAKVEYEMGFFYVTNTWMASPWWYLDAQMLPEYTRYFQVLLLSLEILMSVLVYYNVSLHDASIGVHLSLFIVNYFRSDVTLIELWLSVTLLLKYERVVSTMANIPWIVVGLLIPTVLIPLYSDLWIAKGTVNANFVFFQCYCLWVFVGLGIVEFIRAFLASLLPKK